MPYRPARENGDFGDKTGVILGHEGVGVVQQVGPGSPP